MCISISGVRVCVVRKHKKEIRRKKLEKITYVDIISMF